MHNDPLSVLADNIEEIRKRTAMLNALTDTQISELLRVGGKSSDPVSAFRRVFGNSLCTPEFACFCRELLHGKSDREILSALLPEFTTVGSLYEDGAAAYLPNIYSDAAFSQFSAALPSLTAAPQSSFSAACEEVYHDRCRYCILPLENSKDGPLSSFSRLIAKYELKIFRICDVTAEDEDAVIRFALLRQSIIPKIGTEGYFEIECILPSGITIGTFLSACEVLGAKADRIRTTPLPFSNERTSLHITFRINEECAAPLLLFLRSVLDTYTTDGIYQSIVPPKL